MPPRLNNSVDYITKREFQVLRADLQAIQHEITRPHAEYHLRPGTYGLKYDFDNRTYILTHGGENLSRDTYTEGEKVLERLLQKTLKGFREKSRKTLKQPYVRC